MRGLLFAALMLGATLAAGQPNFKSDWELQQEARGRQDIEVTLPPLPAGELLPFYVSAASSFKFFIDPKSLSVGSDHAVRFTLVARSASGAENVSYEGIRCSDGGQYRVYAIGSGGRWMDNRQSEWRPIEPKSVQRWHNELRDSYFCPHKATIQDAAEGIDALRRGGHPGLAN